MAYFPNQAAGSYDNLKGKIVRVNRGGPDSIEGLFLGAGSDYIVVLAKDGVVYIPTAHVKSISVKLGSPGRTAGTGGNTSVGSRSFMHHIVRACNFYQVLQHLRNQLVQINRGGPEKIEGVLIDVEPGVIVLVVKKELVRVLIAHIKSVTVPIRGNRSNGSGGKKSDGNKNGCKKSNGKKKDCKKETGSGGNRTGGTGGNRTGGNRTGGNRTGGNRTGGNRTGGNRTGGNRTGGNRTGGNRTGGNRSGCKKCVRGTARQAAGGTASSRVAQWDPFPMS